MRIKQITVLGLMGGFLISNTALANPTLTEPIPISAPVGIEVVFNQDVMLTAEKIKKKNDLIEINITYPVISGLTDADFQEQLNQYILKQITKAKDEMESQVEEYAQEAKKNGWEIRPYELYIEYDLKTNNADYLSFTMTYYTYTGGANGMTVVECINIDKKANAFLRLEDLFPEGTDYKTKINNEIKKQIELRSKNNDEMFF